MESLTQEQLERLKKLLKKESVDYYYFNPKEGILILSQADEIAELRGDLEHNKNMLTISIKSDMDKRERLSRRGELLKECKTFLDVIALGSKGSRYQIGLKGEGKKELLRLQQALTAHQQNEGE